jgi:hypothetical protein
VPTYDAIAALPLEIDSYELERREEPVSSGFTRVTTVIRLRGAGEEGVGEDVTYTGAEHDAFQERFAPPGLPVAASWESFDAYSRAVGELDLFLAEPEYPVARAYRRWGLESAALDLALRQAGRSLANVTGREPRPVTFVVSKRLPEPPTLDGLRDWLERYPDLRFKLDPRSSWDDALVAELAATGAVDSVDMKAQYRGTIVDQPPDPALYRRIVDGFPDAWIEDPATDDPECAAVLEPHRERITWDAIIHSIDDIEALPFPPRMLNIKPSRFGSVEALLAAYDYCAERGIRAYGGGQFELGPGRGQIQYLAAIFHPETPNDVAPGGYNEVDPSDGLPGSPLEPRIAPTGFRWE